MEDTVVAPRPVAAFDLDGTLVREQLLVMLTKECIDLQVFRRVVDVLFKKLRLEHRDRKVTFEEYDRKLIALFTERIRGKLQGDVHEAAQRVCEKNRDWLYVFTRTLLQELQSTHQCIAITGAMHEVVSLLAPYWRLEHFYTTELEVDEHGRYTGRDKCVPPVADKGKALLAHTASHPDVTLAGSLAIGDTGSDISMMEHVSMPIAFNPNAVLHERAERSGWPVVLERKDGIYLLTGDKNRRFRSQDAVSAVRCVLEHFHKETTP